jgi:predicted lipoprotein with Yx(FWY)xxD motif
MFRLNLRRAAVLVATAALCAASSVYAAAGVTVSTSSSVGHAILTDDRGMTVYRYTSDQGSASVCYDTCAVAWPAVLVDALPATQDALLSQSLGLAPRADGSQQLTFQNQPLYYFVGDTKPGDTTGQASDGVWFVVDGPTG